MIFKMKCHEQPRYTFGRILYIETSKIVFIETPGPDGNPPGWPVDFSAFVILDGTSNAVGLTAAQWRKLQSILEIIPE